MAQTPPKKKYSVVITGLVDENAKINVARSVERVAKNIPFERILKQLETLPWTLTRTAGEKTAVRLTHILEKHGAEVEVTPPVLSSRSTVLLPTSAFTEPTRKPTSRPPAARKEAGTRPAGDPTGSAPEIEPLTLGGILDRTFNICRSHFLRLFLIMLVPWAAMLVVVLIAAVVAGLVGLSYENLGDQSGVLIIVLAAVLAVPLALFLLAVFYLAQGALIHAVSSVYLGREVKVKAAYGYVYQRLLKFVLTSMLMVAVVLGLIIAPTLLGIFFYGVCDLLTPSGWWSALTWPFLLILPAYAIPKLFLFDKVVIIEGEAYTSALKRSWNLLTGRASGPWPARYYLRFIILLHVFILINIAISLIFTLPSVLLTLVVPQSVQVVAEILGQILGRFGDVVAGIFGSVSFVVFYYDIRCRKEGFDLDMLSDMQDRD